MTFSSIVKNEVSKVETNETERISELSALLRNSEYNKNHILFDTENASLARRVFKFIKENYDVNPAVSVRKGFNYDKNSRYLIEIKHKVEIILNDLSIYNDDFLDIPSSYIIDDEYLIRAYVRGVFLVCGSINDPKKSRYHLEFLVDTENYAYFISDLLNTFYLNAKVLKKGNKYMIYVKEAEKIGDFLRIINANESLFYFEDIRIYRDHKNMTNRLNNCEQANVDKTVMTASTQVEAIEKIISTGGLDLLSEREKVVAEYRLKYKESSLQELSEIISIETNKKITKSGINHRMKKILDLAIKIK